MSAQAIGSTSHDVLSTTPPPVTRFLILSAPFARGARHAAEVLLWRRPGRSGESWAVILAWWVVCLGGGAMLKYLLPPLLLSALFHALLLPPLLPFLSPSHAATSSISPSSTAAGPEAASETTLLVTLSHYSALHTLLAQARPLHLFLDRFDQAHWDRQRTLRALAGVWTGWILGGWIIGTRVMLGLLGTLLLLLPSPYSHPLLAALNSSNFLTRLFHFAAHLVLGPSLTDDGSSSAPSALSWAWVRSGGVFSTKLEQDAAAGEKTRGRSLSVKALLGLSSSAVIAEDQIGTQPQEGEVDKDGWEEEPVLFRFEVMENQRWWLALDWTATLAPGDRPVWCDTHLSPVPPPPAFTLPPSSTITVPSMSHPETHIERRTATWSWHEPDWSILRNVDGSASHSFIPAKGTDGPASAAGASPLPPSSSATNSLSPILGGPSKDATTAASSLAANLSARMSLGEQALSKGLERFKAAAAASSASSHPTSPPPPQSHSSFLPRSESHPTSFASPSSSFSPSSPPRSGGSIPSSSEQQTKTLFSMSNPPASAADAPAIAGEGAAAAGEVEDLEASTDEAGWAYGGNKWEVSAGGMSSKGGLGKFTRRRRWTRKAVCTETVQLVSLPSLTVVVEEDKATATAAGAALRKRGDGARQASEHL